MPKWKKDAKEFVVSVSYNEKRGYQCTLPKPIMLLMGSPTKIKFLLNEKKAVEVKSVN
jgi:hypothetical protein